MNYPYLIDKKRIGIIDFEAYIIEDDNKLEAFAIFFQNNDSPLLFFRQNIPNQKIEISINTELVNELQELKSKNELIRKEHFKEFRTFVLEAEQKAKEIAFQDKRLYYITDVQLLKSIEESYLSV